VELEPERMEFFWKIINGNSVDCQFANRRIKEVEFFPLPDARPLSASLSYSWRWRLASSNPDLFGIANFLLQFEFQPVVA